MRTEGVRKKCIPYNVLPALCQGHDSLIAAVTKTNSTWDVLWCQGRYVFHCTTTQTHNVLFMVIQHVKQWFSSGVHKPIGSWLFVSLLFNHSASSGHSTPHVKVTSDAQTEKKKAYHHYSIASQEICQWKWITLQKCPKVVLECWPCQCCERTDLCTVWIRRLLNCKMTSLKRAVCLESQRVSHGCQRGDRRSSIPAAHKGPGIHRLDPPVCAPIAAEHMGGRRRRGVKIFWL